MFTDDAKDQAAFRKFGEYLLAGDLQNCVMMATGWDWLAKDMYDCLTLAFSGDKQASELVANWVYAETQTDSLPTDASFKDLENALTNRAAELMAEEMA